MANTPSVPYASCYIELAADVDEVGIMIAINSSGKGLAAADTAGLTVVGINEETGDSGDSITAIAGIYRFDASSSHAPTQANIGDTLYVEDETTVSTDGGTNSIIAGICVDVDSNGVWVKVDPTARI